MGVYIDHIDLPIDGHILIVFPSGRVLEVTADETQKICGERQAVYVPPQIIHGEYRKEN